MTMSITKGHTRLIPCSFLSDCKNQQKSVLTNVNIQRTEKTSLQMFAFSFFDGSHICRFLPILRPPAFLGVTLDALRQRRYADYQLLIFADGNFCVGK